jgi:hypothetical protein
MWHESAIWFFIAQKLLFANQYVRKFHKISKFSKNFKITKLKKKNLKVKIDRIEVLICLWNNSRLSNVACFESGKYMQR